MSEWDTTTTTPTTSIAPFSSSDGLVRHPAHQLRRRWRRHSVEASWGARSPLWLAAGRACAWGRGQLAQSGQQHSRPRQNHPHTPQTVEASAEATQATSLPSYVLRTSAGPCPRLHHPPAAGMVRLPLNNQTLTPVPRQASQSCVLVPRSLHQTIPPPEYIIPHPHLSLAVSGPLPTFPHSMSSS
jgi:hypothetical protein